MADPLNPIEDLAQHNAEVADAWTEALTDQGFQVLMIIGINSQKQMRLMTFKSEQLSRKTVRQMLKELYKKI